MCFGIPPVNSQLTGVYVSIQIIKIYRNMLYCCPLWKSFLFFFCWCFRCWFIPRIRHALDSLFTILLTTATLQISHFIQSNTVMQCSSWNTSHTICHYISWADVYPDMTGFPCSQAATHQQNQLLRPHHSSLLATWQNRKNPGQRHSKMEECTSEWECHWYSHQPVKLGGIWLH